MAVPLVTTVGRATKLSHRSIPSSFCAWIYGKHLLFFPTMPSIRSHVHIIHYSILLCNMLEDELQLQGLGMGGEGTGDNVGDGLGCECVASIWLWSGGYGIGVSWEGDVGMCPEHWWWCCSASMSKVHIDQSLMNAHAFTSKRRFAASLTAHMQRDQTWQGLQQDKFLVVLHDTGEETGQ